MSILHMVGEYDRGYGEGYFCSYALAIPLSQKAEYIYNPVVPKGWGNLVLQKIDLGGFLLSLAEFLASSPYSLLTLQVTTLFLPENFPTVLAISCPNPILRPPHHVICWALRKSIRHVFSRAHPPNRPSTFTTLQSNCQRRAAFPDFQHTS
jgi:hypothetical protein